MERADGGIWATSQRPSTTSFSTSRSSRTKGTAFIRSLILVSCSSLSLSFLYSSFSVVPRVVGFVRKITYCGHQVYHLIQRRHFIEFSQAEKERTCILPSLSRPRPLTKSPPPSIGVGLFPNGISNDIFDRQASTALKARPCASSTG